MCKAGAGAERCLGQPTNLVFSLLVILLFLERNEKYGTWEKIISNHAARNVAKCSKGKVLWVLLCIQLGKCAAEVWLEVDPGGGWKQSASSRNLI